MILLSPKSVYGTAEFHWHNFVKSNLKTHRALAFLFLKPKQLFSLLQLPIILQKLLHCLPPQ